MPRDKGWLKPDALANGVDEQYAVDTGEGVVSVTLSKQRFGGYVVTESRPDEQDRVEFGVHLHRARNEFRRRVRALGGRA